MFHLDNETGVPVMPDLPPTQSNEAKWFTEGGNGVSPSWPGSTWFNIIQAEMLNVLAAAGITPDKENLSQLSEAITNLINSDSNTFLKVANNLSEIEDAGPAAVAAAWNHLGIGALLTGALQKANNLSEIKTAGPAAVAQTLENLGLGDAAKRDMGEGNANVPDIATADNRYLKQSGGKVTGDSAPIIIRAATLNAALYLLAQQSDGSGAWYLGMPVAGNNKLALRSYANACEISLSSGRADVTVPLYIEGGKAYYPGNKPPLTNVWVSGEYTPVLNTATVVSHGIAGLDPLLCRADVLLKCVTANNGYFPGDFAVNFNIHSSANTSAAPLPLLTATQIQLNTGAAGTGLQITNKSSGDVFSPALSNWRYVFRVFY